MTEVGTRPAVDPLLEDEDDDQRFSHYVKRDDAMRAAVDGVPVVALCGKTWVPVRDPDRFPVCPKCAELMDLLRAMD